MIVVSAAPSKPRVAVLMAAYNGTQWLQEQVDSILGQQGVDVTLFVSVDISSDNTEQWVTALSEADARVVPLPYGLKFGGAAKNFFRLIRDVDFSGYDYISFADQDDIWVADKLVSAHQALSNTRVSAYSGNVTAFWPDGRQVILNKAQAQQKYDFIFEAAGPGCSYVLKVAEASAFKQFLVDNWSAANNVSLHDWLMYAWFRAQGLAWFIDPCPKILYRQHANNQVGANEGVKALMARLSLMRSGWYRAEIAKITQLLSADLPTLPAELKTSGKVPLSFLVKNFNCTRRRLRDRFLLAIVIIFGIY
ncbi:glycosyltransferase [Pseudomonas sp. ICMP 460]|uniref:glycosyltransferase n=1 Tax=Pseudomonas sp. ICMP 460 TaxID=1718917 RepID=UPI000C08604E|nr:glycosyltransferase [Pseudomonas sp. ICMP 460]PHN21776.1 glycosyl transferase [Pseudomonas sp. ICMP 460]